MILCFFARMSRFHSYLQSATAIVSSYTCEEPFSSYIKQYFSRYKKFGSNDRKTITHLCYCYFRTGRSLDSLPVEDRILSALFLCQQTSHPVLRALQPQWDEAVHASPVVKYERIGLTYSEKSIFTFAEQLSCESDRALFEISHLIQPDLFLRIRPGKKDQVLNDLHRAGIIFRELEEQVLVLSNSSKIDSVLAIDQDVVVQDYSSQRIGSLLQLLIDRAVPINHVWDCCAASGGKSILAYDKLKDIHLTVSDIRSSILVNLDKRFKLAGINKYHAFVADLSKENAIDLSSFAKPDLILADVPCSGSGTWGRTPEQLTYFQSEQIDRYALLQKKIVSTASSFLKPGGYLLYSTCSVFQKENEEVVSYLEDSLGFEVIHKELYKGFEWRADSLFGALLRKRVETN